MNGAFTDGATGEFYQYAGASDIPLCGIYAVKTVQKGAGIDVRINPDILADPVVTQAFIQDMRIILDRIEEKYVKGAGR
jgi:hypothetical protein